MAFVVYLCYQSLDNVKHMRNLKFVACVVLALGLAACKKNGSQITDIKGTIEYETSERIDGTICYLGSLGATKLGPAIQMRTNLMADNTDAEILVVTSAELDANKEVLKKAWEDDKIIVELFPDASAHEAFWNYAGGPAYLKAGEAHDLVLLAVKRFSCYQLQDPFAEGVFELDQDELEEDKATESAPGECKDFTNYNAVPVRIADTEEFWNTKISSFVSWLNRNVGTVVPNAAIPSFDGDIFKRITDANYCQCITKTFNVGVDNYRICKVIFSDPDVVSRHSTVDVTIYIAPLYSYEMNNNTKGDFYFVTTEVVSHNKPLYGLYKEWHGAVRTWAHVFFGKQMKMDYKLLDSNRQPMSNDVISFFQTPCPETTVDSRTYNKGFSAGLNVNGQAGVAGGKFTGMITVGGAFTWSNSVSRTVSDQSIVMSTDTRDRSVSYTFHCNNDREEDETEEAIPALARSDQKSEASWIWHVNNTKDDDTTTSFVLQFDLNPVYRCRWRHTTWSAEGDYRDENLLAPASRVNYFNVVKPNRIRSGVLEIKATSSQYMQGLTIRDLNDKVVAKDDGSYEKNQIQRYQLPVGVYNVDYFIQDGDTGQILSKRRIEGVKIETSETTKKSSMDGKIVD